MIHEQQPAFPEKHHISRFNRFIKAFKPIFRIVGASKQESTANTKPSEQPLSASNEEELRNLVWQKGYFDGAQPTKPSDQPPVSNDKRFSDSVWEQLNFKWAQQTNTANHAQNQSLTPKDDADLEWINNGHRTGDEVVEAIDRSK